MPKMQCKERKAPADSEMSEAAFMKLCSIIRSEWGINITPVKKVMLTVRLTRRIKALGLASFAQYVKYLDSAAGRDNELRHMIDAVSTNKTDFFRESDHFDYLSRVAVPYLDRVTVLRGQRSLNIWSAGCSSGEEPYTIAMVMSNYSENKPGFRYKVHATDISNRVLSEAQKAVYPDHVVESIPPELRRKYMLRGKDRTSGYYRVAPEIRSRVSFMRHNLADREFHFEEPMHVIFCRNVIIYLDRAVQKSLFDNFHSVMHESGYLFVGHSETLDGITNGFVRVAPTIYRRR